MQEYDADSVSDFALLDNKGKGLPLVFLSEQGEHLDMIRRIYQNSKWEGRSLLVSSPKMTNSNWAGLIDRLRDLLSDQTIRQASFVAAGDSCALMQGFALTHSKIVRRMALINPLTRAHATSSSGIVDWIEERLPLGLPLRKVGSAFDGRPFLHRIRCPVMVITTKDADSHVQHEAQLLARGMATAWLVPGSDLDSAGIAAVIAEFQDIAAKRPQKSRAVK